MAHHQTHPGAPLHLGHSEHYNLGSGSPHPLSKPRSRTHLEMENEEGLKHHGHHLQQPQQHHQHPLSIHPPPTKLHKSSEYDMMGRGLPLGSGDLFSHNPLHGSPASVYGTGLPPMPSFGHDHGLRTKLEHEDMERMDRNSQSSSPHPAEDVAPGAPGMPQAMPRPLGPKLKFTPDDDALLVELKENRALSWKQIAEYFPGRTSGTLQVRYCTKLKAKTVMWNDEMVQKLRNAVLEYEQDRWRHIASKVGSGFTPAACREKSREIFPYDHRE